MIQPKMGQYLRLPVQFQEVRANRDCYASSGNWGANASATIRRGARAKTRLVLSVGMDKPRCLFGITSFCFRRSVGILIGCHSGVRGSTTTV